MSTNLNNVADQLFDYIIAGGGTAGLTLAAKLTEDSSRSVLVLEAGGENIDDPIILRPGNYGVQFGNDSYAWSHKTVPQKFAGGVQIAQDRGKGLGGSSSINFFGWNKPPADDINDFERLGNPDWTWERFNDALQKLEGFVAPSDEMLAHGQLKAGLWQLGTEGPLKLTFPPTMDPMESVVQQTMFNLGIPPAPNPLGGDPRGYFLGPNTHDPKTYTRSYATTAFYIPNTHRSNLHVLVHAHVVRVTLKPSRSDDMIATGVEFLHGGEHYSVHARREVIVCAGAIKSPQILELSGIGDPVVLNKIKVPVKVNLPGVGSNIQDHTLVGITFEFKDTATGKAFETFDNLSDPAIAAEHDKLHKSLKGHYTRAVVTYAFCNLHMISPRADEIIKYGQKAIDSKAGACAPGTLEQYRRQLDRIKYGRPGIEILAWPGHLTRPNPPIPGRRYLTFNTGNYSSLSRGTIHCVSADPLQDPELDPNYFIEDIDLQVLVESLRFLRKLAATAPLKDVLGPEINPGPLVEPDNDEQMREYIKKAFIPPWHLSSSCSMLPREKGGVVDAKLKVYGTANLRVVDLSIIPMHIAAHPQATVYGIAACAAGFIIGGEV